MKILNNRSVNIIGSHFICSSCGAELEIEKSDPIKKKKDYGSITRVEVYNYEGKDALLATKEFGTLMLIECASCGELIGFFYFGDRGYENATIINPKRYYIYNYDDNWYVVDIALYIGNEIYNESHKFYEHKYDEYGSLTTTIQHNNQPVQVYMDSENDIIDTIKKKYGYVIDSTELNKRIPKGNLNEFNEIRIDIDIPLNLNTVYLFNVRANEPHWFKYR